MKRITVGLLSLLTAALCLSAEPPVPREARGKQWEDYRILIERNIFSRDRGRAAFEAEAPERTVPREEPAPERYVLLRGVVRREGEFVALLEDMRSGELIHTRTGDQLVRGTVNEVRLDGIEYVFAGESRRVSVGENLERSDLPTPLSATVGQTGDTDTVPIPGAGGPAADILERMRQRRERQLEQ